MTHPETTVDHSKIVPFGDYCYEPLRLATGPDGMPRMERRLCSHFSRPDDGCARCGLLNVSDDFLLDDECKICGINVDDAA